MNSAAGDGELNVVESPAGVGVVNP